MSGNIATSGNFARGFKEEDNPWDSSIKVEDRMRFNHFNSTAHQSLNFSKDLMGQSNSNMRVRVTDKGLTSSLQGFMPKYTSLDSHFPPIRDGGIQTASHDKFKKETSLVRIHNEFLKCQRKQIESASRRNLIRDISVNYPNIKGIDYGSMINMDFVKMHEHL